MTFDLPTVGLEVFALAALALAALGFVAHRLPDRPHQALVLAVSGAVIFYLDAVSACLLLVFAHAAWWLLRHEVRSKRALTRLAYGGVAALMGYKFVQAGGQWLEWNDVLLLLGVSYYTFRIASTLIDAARGRITSVDYLEFMTYCLFFPIFAGGPVQRYQTFQREPNANWDENIAGGLTRLASGIVKKLFVADIVLVFFIDWLKAQALGDPTFSIHQNHADALKFGLGSPLPAFVAALLFGFVSILRAYVDLSAFTDLALGLARLFGYRISENFDRPLLACNMIDFWRRWHLTIAGWARDYVFSPLAIATRNMPLSVMLTMIAMGLWHHPSLPWLFWGLAHGVGLLACGWWQRRPVARSLVSRRRTIEASVVSVVGKLPASTAISQVTARTIGVVLFAVPAWLLCFGYMSIVFIAVSADSADEAWRIYRAMGGGGDG